MFAERPVKHVYHSGGKLPCRHRCTAAGRRDQGVSPDFIAGWERHCAGYGAAPARQSLGTSRLYPGTPVAQVRDKFRRNVPKKAFLWFNLLILLKNFFVPGFSSGKFVEEPPACAKIHVIRPGYKSWGNFIAHVAPRPFSGFSAQRLDFFAPRSTFRIWILAKYL